MESKSEGRFTFEVIHALISRNEYPSSFSKEDKRSLRRRVKCFDTVDGELYYVGSTRKRPRYYTYSYRYIFVSTYCYMQYYIFKKGDEKRLVVEDKEQRKRIIGAIHDPSHMGVNRTLDMITAKYYWPGQTNEVKEYVSEAGLYYNSIAFSVFA